MHFSLCSSLLGMNFMSVFYYSKETLLLFSSLLYLMLLAFCSHTITHYLATVCFRIGPLICFLNVVQVTIDLIPMKGLSNKLGKGELCYARDRKGDVEELPITQKHWEDEVSTLVPLSLIQESPKIQATCSSVYVRRRVFCLLQPSPSSELSVL